MFPLNGNYAELAAISSQNSDLGIAGTFIVFIMSFVSIFAGLAILALYVPIKNWVHRRHDERKQYIVTLRVALVFITALMAIGTSFILSGTIQASV